MSEHLTLKKAYQSPTVMDLGELARGSGDCLAGSGVTIDCTAGPTAIRDCTAGGTATNACTAGTSATVACSAGDVDTTGGCTGGATPARFTI